MCGLEHTKESIDCQPFSTLVSASYLQTGLSVQVHERGLVFKNETISRPERPPCTWTRGDVDEFSHESRKRLLRKFACLRTYDLREGKFLTLTYHHSYKKDTSKAIKDLMTFLQFLRDRYPGVRYIWRLEMQKRGAPHFHILIFFANTIKSTDLVRMEKVVSEAWHRIADKKSVAHLKYGCKMVEMTSMRKSFAYLSKYIAKEIEGVVSEYKGRRWGHSRNMDFSPLLDVDITHDVWVVVRRLVRRLLRSRGKISLDFMLYLKTDESAFVYINATTALDMIHIAQKVREGPTLPAGERKFLNDYARSLTS